MSRSTRPPRTSSPAAGLLPAIAPILSLLACPGCHPSDSSSAPAGDPPAGSSALILDGSQALSHTTSRATWQLAGTVVSTPERPSPPGVEWTLESPTRQESGDLIPDGEGRIELSLDLEPGDQTLTLTPEAGASTRVVLTHNPDFALASRTRIVPDVLWTGEARTISVNVLLTDPDTDPSNVWLVELDGDTEVELLRLVDDGDLGASDEIEADGLFSGRVQLLGGARGERQLRVRIGRLSTSTYAWGEVACLRVASRLTETRLQEITSLQRELGMQLQAGYEDGALDAARLEVRAELRQRDDVESAELDGFAGGVMIVWDEGVLGYVSPSPSGSRGGAQSPQGRATRARGGASFASSNPASVSTLPPMLPLHGEPAGASLAAESHDTGAVRSARARAISPYQWVWGETEAEDAQAWLTAAGFTVELFGSSAPGTGELEAFRNIGQVGALVVATHGTRIGGQELALARTRHGWELAAVGAALLATGNAADPSWLNVYDEDLARGRVLLWNDEWALSAGFFARWSGYLPGTLVWLGACHGGPVSDLAQTLVGLGAGAVLGFHGEVSTSWPRTLATTLIEPLAADAAQGGSLGLDVGQLWSALEEPGSPDPATWTLQGSAATHLGVADLPDPGFEAGWTRQAWSPSGDVRALRRLGPFQPTEGRWCALLGTGLGYAPASGTLRQAITLPESPSELVFDWNFLSEEFMEYVGSGYQDAFAVRLEALDDSGDAETLLFTYVDALASEVTPVWNGFDQGDVWATGWREARVAVPASFRGRRSTLSFATTDVGDSEYDTGVLIDDVRLDE